MKLTVRIPGDPLSEHPCVPKPYKTNTIHNEAGSDGWWTVTQRVRSPEGLVRTVGACRSQVILKPGWR